MDAKWCFPSSNGGEKRGLNDSGIETFNDNPVKSLAREICQNSLDAAVKDKTAIVEFNTFMLNTIDFPDVLNYKDILNKCYDFSKGNKNPKTPNFFKNAIAKFENTQLRMLRISDFNTTGLSGSDWDNLVNSSGASEKSEGKGGSFGIGKNAPFACSECRTVFYSTLALDGSRRSKGVSKLISFKLGENADGSDNLSQGAGYYGIDNSYNILEFSKMLELDQAFKRTSSGTDIFVAALKTTSDDDFKANIIAEVLDGFLVAIWNGKLEIRVNGYIINKDTLSTVVEAFSKSLSDNTKMCFNLLADSTTKWVSIPITLSGTMVLGSINFGFKLRIDGTNKVSMIRGSGMKILDKSNLCPSLRFVGLATIQGELLNNLLRSLENPSHNKWEPQRGDDPAFAKTLLRNIYNSITDNLNKEASSIFDDQVDIEGAGDYLPDEFEEGKNNNHENVKREETLNKIINVEVKVIEKPKSVAHLETDELGDDIDKSAIDEGGIVDGGNLEGLKHQGQKFHGFGERDLDDISIIPDDDFSGEQLITVKAKEIRLFCLNKKAQLYRLIFIPTENSIKGYVSIFKLAEQNEKMPLNIICVEDASLECAKNKIGYFKFKDGEPNKVDFRIDDEEYVTMEVRLYAYKS